MYRLHHIAVQDPRGFVAKLSDFGMSVLLDESKQREVKKGSVEYMPHDHFLDGHVTSKTDVYSLGIVMWEMWHGDLWEDIYRRELNQQRFDEINMSNFRPVCDSACPHGYRQIVESCLSPDDKRPPVSEVLRKLQRLCVDLVELLVPTQKIG